MSRGIATGVIPVVYNAKGQPNKIASYVDKTIIFLIMCAIEMNVLMQHIWPFLKKEYAKDANSDAQSVILLNFANTASLDTIYIKDGAT